MATTGGSSFFPDQQRLLEVVLATRALASEIGADLSAHLPEPLINSTLRRRRSIMVLGAVNVGKSTLINALCRAPICPVSKLPETKSIAIHQADDTPPDNIPPNSTRTFRHQDISSLRDFTFIDTPGTNGFTPDTLATIRELSSSCDALLVVLAATNPWEPATWDVLSKLAEPDLSKLVLVLQQADLRPPQDVDVLVGHVADLARKRCGISPQVFPLSAPNHTEEVNPACADIWQHIVHGIRNAPEFQNQLADWKNRTTNALRALDDHIDLAHRDLGTKNRLLDGIEQDISRMHASFRRQLESRIDELAASFRIGNDDTLRLLRKRLRFLPSLLRLFGRDRTAGTMEDAFVARLKSSFQNIGKEDAMAIIASCRDHAHATGTRLQQENLALPLARQDLERHLSEAEQRFRDNLDQAAGVRLESVRVRNHLAKELRRRNRALNAFTASCLLFLTLGAVGGGLGILWAAYTLCAVALIFLIGALVTAWRTTPRVLDVFDQQMSDACDSFAKALLTDYEDALRGVFRDYSETMLPLRSSLSQNESSIKPLQKRWQELFLRVRTLEEEN